MKRLYLMSFTVLLTIQIVFLGQVLAQEPVIDKHYILEKKQRVDRTNYDFSYRVKITNTGVAIKNVHAIVSSSSANTVVIDGSVQFNDIPAGGASLSIDTFTIRQNRLFPFNPNSLVWNVQYELADTSGLPPDPGEQGLLTIVGVDSDSNGVRDDVQIAIANRYPSNTNAKLALSQAAKAIQHAFISQTSNDIQGLNNAFLEIIAATDCITITSPSPHEDITFIQILMENTNERSQAYIDINNKASGQFFGGADDLQSACQR